MKKLADYQNDEAIELWADLLEPMTSILGDKAVANVIKSGKPPFLIAKEILKTHTEDAKKIMLRIDPTPIDGLNIITRLVSLVLEFLNNDDLKSFFPSAEQAKKESESSISVVESTQDAGV